jgi:23S rRNA-/tRNA-specific pseudouridylate synthase
MDTGNDRQDGREGGVRHTLLLLEFVMELPLHDSCRILKADPCGLLAVDKAEGILSHPNPGKSGEATLLSLPYDHEKEAYQGDGRTLYLLNRLDGPTSGVILLADSSDVAAAIKEAFAEHAVEKTYVAVVKGIPPRTKDTWRDCLQTGKRGGALRTEVVRGRPDAECRMKLLQRGGGVPARAMIQLQPSTGRTHQLRVQCASRRLPVIGDGTYGDFAFNRDFRRKAGSRRLFLHSWKTSLTVKVGGRQLSFSAESPVPEVFAVALQ